MAPFTSCLFAKIRIGTFFKCYLFKKKYLVDHNFEELSLGDDLVFIIGGINDKYHGIGSCIISRPNGSNPLLASQIPRW